MYKTSLRRLSQSRPTFSSNSLPKTIPYISKPQNKYNEHRSAFNFKPSPKSTQGLIHNPPQSAPSLKQTPRAFLPANDPRRTLLSGTRRHRVYSDQELADMPLIHGYSKDKTYDITPETVGEINKLRSEDPAQWTISKLAKKFGLPQYKVNVLTEKNDARQQQIQDELRKEQESWNDRKIKARLDRKKRVDLWLRNEF